MVSPLSCGSCVRVSDTASNQAIVVKHRLGIRRQGRARTRNRTQKEQGKKRRKGFVGYLPFSTLISGPSPLRSLSLEHRTRPAFVRQLPRPTIYRQRAPSASHSQYSLPRPAQVAFASFRVIYTVLSRPRMTDGFGHHPPASSIQNIIPASQYCI